MPKSQTFPEQARSRVTPASMVGRLAILAVAIVASPVLPGAPATVAALEDPVARVEVACLTLDRKQVRCYGGHAG